MRIGRTRLVLASLSAVAALLSACGSNSSPSTSPVKDVSPQTADAAAAAAAASDPTLAFEALVGYFSLKVPASDLPAAPATPTAPLTGSESFAPAATTAPSATVQAWVSKPLDNAAVLVTPADGSQATVTPQSFSQDFQTLEALPQPLQDAVQSQGLRFPVRVFLFQPSNLSGSVGVVTELPTDGSQPGITVKPMACNPFSGDGC